MNQVKFPSKGISGKQFMAIELAILALIFATGLFFLAPSGGVVNSTLSIGWYLGEVGIKLGFACVIALVQAYIIFTHVLDTPLNQLKNKFEKSRNDSHAYILAGIMISVAVALAMAGGKDLTQYVYQLCTRVAIGYAMATFSVIFAARLFGVKSMDQFRDWIDTEDNDSYAILTAGTLVFSMIIAMSV